MKRFLTSALAAATVVGFVGTSFASPSIPAAGTGAVATKTGVTAKVKIVTPISLSSDGALDFGEVVAGHTTGGSVILTPANAISTTGDTWIRGASVNTHSVPSFTAAGEAGYVWSISMPTVVHLAAANAGLDVDTWTFTSDVATSGNVFGAANGSGATAASAPHATPASKDFNLGATLHVPADFTPDNYSADFDVTVYYE